MPIKDELHKYFGKLINRFLFIRRLNDELLVMDEWLTNKPDGINALNGGASFFNLVQRSFNLTLLLELCKFIDEDEEKSLRDWLIKAKDNAKPLAPTKFNKNSGKHELVKVKTYQDIVSKHLCELDALEKIISYLKSRRDKAIAHTDASFFNNPQKHFEKYPLMIDDIDKLLESISNILREQYVYIFGSDSDLSTVYTVTDLNRVLQFVRGFYRAQKDKELQKKGINIMKYKWDKVK